MPIINKDKIQERIKKREIIITPILETEQIKDSAIDLRLGTKFKVSRQTRKAYLSVEDLEHEKFFDSTQRKFGEEFILFPGQLVLASTFEYIKIPLDLVGHIFSRSSINRLGIRISSIVQPGYYGSLTIELLNSGENPICLKVGMRLIQLSLSEIEKTDADYKSKYSLSTGPTISKIYDDKELKILKKIGDKF